MSEAVRGPGPEHPVNALPGVGFSSPEPWVVDVEPGDGVAVVSIPVPSPDLEVGRGRELCWVIHPESAAADARRWDSTYACVDAVFDDGTRLGEVAVDQYGDALTPDGQGEGRRLWVDQWNLRRVALDDVADRRIERVEVRVRRSEVPVRIFLDDIGVRPAQPRPATRLDAVVTTRGTHSSDRFSRGNNAPLVGLPHGGVFGLPMTNASAGNWPYSWHGQPRPALQAFATSHIPSPWMGDRGVFQMMPSPLAEPDCDRERRALSFDRASESAGPHRYAVDLDGGVSAELFPGDFALGLRLRGARSLILDHHGRVTAFSSTSEGEETVVSALLDDRDGMPAHYLHLRVPGVVHDALTYDGDRLSGFLTVEGEVDVRLGISTVSDAQAAENLRAAGDIEEMARTARQAWERVLATVSVEGASDDQLVSLYSGLYRLFLYPNRYGEGPGQVHRSPYDLTTVRRGNLSTTHGFWDTYRTAWPLLALLDSEGAGELAEGFIEHFRDRGWTPRWSAPGAEDCMTGTTFDTVLADLAVRGVSGFDLEDGYASVVRNATVPADDVRVGRKGLRPGIFTGYIDTATPEGLSWTLDNAINDWGAAQLAAIQHAQADEPARERLAAEREYFARRALGYRAVFDTERGFFIGRTPTGEWREDFHPDVWGFDYTETNAWGTRFTAPHDGAGLVELYGGEEAFGAALDEFFAHPETGDVAFCGSYGFVIHEQTEARDVRMGMLGLSNQPAHHIPFMYSFAGRHDDAHRIVRECLDRLFVGSDFGQGYPGDEDNGEMSAWYVLATLGLYPLAPSTGTWLLVPPSVPRAELRPIGGEPIVIETVGTGAYIRAVTRNGQPWHEITISDADLAGAHLVVELSEQPCGWAADSRPPSASVLSGFDRPLRDVAVGDGPLVDDRGETPVPVRAGDSVEVALSDTLSDTGPLTLYAVTSAEPGTLGWRVDYLDDAGRGIAVEVREAEIFEWAGQTRPFRVRRGEATRAAAVRFTALADCVLTQLEFFDA